MRAGSLSERTVHSRRNLVRLLATRTGADPVTCSWEPLAAFLTALPSAGTRVTYQADLRAWFAWLVLTGVRPDNPALLLRKAKRPRRRPRPLSVEQLGQVLSVRMHYRTRVAILLEAYAGFRASEVASTRGEYLRVRPGWIRVLGKGGTDELVPVHPLVAEAAAVMPAIGWWFPSNSTRPGEHVHGNSISAMISAAIRRAGIHGVGHQLRHLYGTQSLRANGGNIRQTQELMRHANIASTAIYTEISQDEMVATINRLPVPLHMVWGGA